MSNESFVKLFKEFGHYMYQVKFRKDKNRYNDRLIKQENEVQWDKVVKNIKPSPIANCFKSLIIMRIKSDLIKTNNMYR